MANGSSKRKRGGSKPSTEQPGVWSVEDQLARYVQAAHAAAAPTVVDEPTSSSPSHAVDPLCATGCKRKHKFGCTHFMCAQCCAEQPTSLACPAHFRDRQKAEEEARYFAEGMKAMASKKRKTNFYHYEARFQNFGETVLLWCTRDFCRSKRASKDVLEQNTREEQSRNLKRKREQSQILAALATAVSSSSSSSGSGSSSSGGAGGGARSGQVVDLSTSVPVKGDDVGLLGRGPKVRIFGPPGCVLSFHVPSHPLPGACAVGKGQGGVGRTSEAVALRTVYDRNQPRTFINQLLSSSVINGTNLFLTGFNQS